jgi:plasmid stabilization system protein ParE
MEKKKKVNWSLNAMLMLGELYEYLEEQLGSLKATDYLNDLMDFGNSLEVKSTRHSFCRNQKLQSKGYRCARFRKKYILVYKTDKKLVNILGVVHAGRGPEVFEDLVE